MRERRRAAKKGAPRDRPRWWWRQDMVTTRGYVARYLATNPSASPSRCGDAVVDALWRQVQEPRLITRARFADLLELARRDAAIAGAWRSALITRGQLRKDLGEISGSAADLKYRLEKLSWWGVAALFAARLERGFGREQLEKLRSHAVDAVASLEAAARNADDAVWDLTEMPAHPVPDAALEVFAARMIYALREARGREPRGECLHRFVDAAVNSSAAPSGASDGRRSKPLDVVKLVKRVRHSVYAHIKF